MDVAAGSSRPTDEYAQLYWMSSSAADCPTDEHSTRSSTHDDAAASLVHAEPTYLVCYPTSYGPELLLHIPAGDGAEHPHSYVSQLACVRSTISKTFCVNFGPQGSSLYLDHVMGCEYRAGLSLHLHYYACEEAN